LLYTDGVTEASAPDGDLFSEERLVEAAVRHRHGRAHEIHDLVLEDVRQFQQGNDPDDDLTLIVVKRSSNGTAAVAAEVPA
jgi:sigma-B regulation protein RsbU (phosphoserine phosphatase)